MDNNVTDIPLSYTTLPASSNSMEDLCPAFFVYILSGSSIIIDGDTDNPAHILVLF